MKINNHHHKIPAIVLAFILSGTIVSCTNTSNHEKIENQDAVLGSATLSQETNPHFPICVDVPNGTICIVEVSATQSGTKVNLEFQPESSTVGVGWLAFALPDLESEDELGLIGKSGNSYFLEENSNDLLAEFDDERKVYKQTLIFDKVRSDEKELSLKIPLLSIKVASKGSFKIDLGTNPQAGQVINMDSDFTIQDQVFKLDKAEFEGDGKDSLRVTIYSEPVSLPENLSSIQPVLGMPDGFSLGFGSKAIINGSRFRAYADLISASGDLPISGVIDIPIEGMIYNYRGPFEITFPLPWVFDGGIK